MWGAWVSQSVKRPTLAQVMILWFMSSELSAQRLKTASDSTSPSLSAPPLLVFSLCLSRNLNLKCDRSLTQATSPYKKIL